MIAPHPFVADDPRRGRLVAPFAVVARTPGAYYLACRPHRPKSARPAAFEDWLLGEARAVRDG